ncbi:MAG: flavodoxin family protein [Clostridia bacterium]|nr:flavodoxin family protein [Clostridia bacterium]
MKVVLVNGSPHERGCTYTALREVQKILETYDIQTEIMWIGTKAISGCIGCNQCLKKDDDQKAINRCFIDDKVNEFLDKVKDTDGFVFGTPVHFASASGQITSFLDRVFYGRGEMFSNKVATTIVSCRRGGATATFDQINKYALMSNMYVVGSNYWNQVHGTTPDEVKQDLEGIQTMQNLAKNMAYIIKCIKVGEKLGVEKPKYDAKIKTNYIR